MNVPGLVIGAPRSGTGKTTITLGILRAMKQRGLVVAPFKCGPDYIDTAFHHHAAGRESVNLDSWAMPPATIASLAQDNAQDADLAIAEALMGFFDGVAAKPDRSGSSADVAAALGWPLVLVLDVSGQAQTAAALACGFANYDPRIRLAGVILNKVASERHRRLASDAIETRGISVFGAVPRNASIELPERHLGLVQAGETQALDARLDAMAQLIAANVDLDAMRAVARTCHASASGHLAERLDSRVRGHDRRAILIAPPAQRIALARDAAFSFIYPHLVAAWRTAGAEIRYFSPLADEPPPQDCDFCWLPGGYPELHAGRLAANGAFRDGLRSFAATRPVHGECGGYMVLGQGLIDADGTRHEMTGLLGVETSFAKRRLHLGYREAKLAGDHVLGIDGALLRGHEFHYATATREEGRPFAYARDAHGGTPMPSGLRDGNVSGSFFHMIAQG